MKGCESSRLEITTSFADEMKGLQKFAFGPFGENTYLVEVAAEKVVVVDPGMSNGPERAAFDQAVAATGRQLVDCLLTHAHLDHVAGLGHVSETYGCQPRLHPDDAQTYRQAPISAQLYGFPMDPLPENVRYDLAHGQVLSWGEGRQLEVRFVPGHAPGHVVFICHEEGWLIGGDTLFDGSVGRTDLPGGDAATLMDSIRRELYVLPEEMLVHPGHGPVTTIGKESRTNPFVRGAF
jgi:hydroxyacylglutathione hydrolase